MNSDRQQWSFSLYNFEDNSRISKEDLTNLVRSIYDALGKSVDKVKQSPKDHVQKLKVHISVSKEKKSKDMLRPGSSVVPRREVVIGAEDGTTEKQLEQLQLKENPEEAIMKKSRKRKEEKYSTVKVLNNDLGKARLQFAKCKSYWSAEDKHCNKTAGKNNNLLADKPHIPVRKQTGPGGCIPDGKIAMLPEDLAEITEKKAKTRSQRRSSRRKPTYSGHVSPDAHVSGYSSPVGNISGHVSPGGEVLTKDVPLDPSYAYHAEDSNYLYVHAAPRQTPFQEPRSGGRRKSKHRRARESGEKPEGSPLKFPGGTSLVHRHEHVHHHYHHYTEKH